MKKDLPAVGIEPGTNGENQVATGTKTVNNGLQMQIPASGLSPETKREKRINLDVGPTNKHKKNDVKDRWK